MHGWLLKRQMGIEMDFGTVLIGIGVVFLVCSRQLAELAAWVIDKVRFDR